MAVVGIVPAAGRGERLGSDGPKAFVACEGRPLVEWSLDVLDEVCDRVVMAVPEGWETGGAHGGGGGGGDGRLPRRGRRRALGVGARRAGGGSRGHDRGGARCGAPARDTRP